MTRRRLFTLILPGMAILLVLAGRPANRATAQIPDPSPVLTNFVGESTDGQGLVVTWTVAVNALNSDYFTIFRRPGAAPAGSGMEIAVVAGNLRGYTDYSVPAPGAWCYQVVSVAGSRFTYASSESCAIFVTGAAGIAGTKPPVLGAGCSHFYQNQPVGTPMSSIAARFDPPGSVISLWRFDVAEQRLVAGYFAAGNVPADFTLLPATNEFEFACLAAPATYRST